MLHNFSIDKDETRSDSDLFLLNIEITTHTRNEASLKKIVTTKKLLLTIREYGAKYEEGFENLTLAGHSDGKIRTEKKRIICFTICVN